MPFNQADLNYNGDSNWNCRFAATLGSFEEQNRSFMMQMKLYVHILNQTQVSEVNSGGLDLSTVILWDPGPGLEITQPN